MVMKNQKPADYPECEKWGKVHSDAVAITGFVEWADWKYPDVYLRPSLQDQLYEYFDIDAKKLEEERRAMIESLRA